MIEKNGSVTEVVSSLLFGVDPRSLIGAELTNKHTLMKNRVADVLVISGRVIIYIGTTSSHDTWTPEDVEKHYHSPNTPIHPEKTR